MVRRALLFSLLAVTMAGVPSQADVILSNYPPDPPVIAGSVLGTDDGNTAAINWKGVGLTVGSENLRFISLRGYFSNGAAIPRTISGGIYFNNGGVPGTLADLFIPQVIAGSADQVDIVFSSSTPGFQLFAGQTYWFALTSDSTNGQGDVLWLVNTVNDAPVALSDNSFVGYAASTDNSNNWVLSNINNLVQINAANAPEPASFALFGIGLGLLPFVRRRSA